MQNGDLYRALLDHMLNGLAYYESITDQDGNITDWRRVFVNKAFAKQTGIKDAISQTVVQTFPHIKDTDNEIFEVMGRVSQSQVPEKVDNYYQSYLHAWFDITVFSVRTGTVALVFENITEKKKHLAELEYTQDKLREAYAETILGWSSAMDLRNRETKGHSERVKEMTFKLMGFMNYFPSNAEKIGYGALLHDIGKIGVPDAILLKEGPLSEEEKIVMRNHPNYAYQFLSNISYLKDAINIPYCHHEKWDGTGYPRGLLKNQIPFEVCVFSVIDVYDALTSKRPYRIALKPATALEYIKSEKGKYFNPVVAENFLKMMEDA